MDDLLPLLRQWPQFRLQSRELRREKYRWIPRQRQSKVARTHGSRERPGTPPGVVCSCSSCTYEFRKQKQKRKGSEHWKALRDNGDTLAADPRHDHLGRSSPEPFRGGVDRCVDRTARELCYRTARDPVDSSVRMHADSKNLTGEGEPETAIGFDEDVVLGSELQQRFVLGIVVWMERYL